MASILSQPANCNTACDCDDPLTPTSLLTALETTLETGIETASVSTTDATVTTLDTFAITASTTYFIESTVTARRTGGTAGTADDGATYVRRAFVTTKLAVVTLVTAGLTQDTAEDQAAWDCAFAVSGATILLRVTGAVNNDIDWKAFTLVRSVT